VFQQLTGRQAMTSFRKTKTRKHASEQPTQVDSPEHSAAEQPADAPLTSATTAEMPPIELLTKEQVCARLKVCIRKFDKMLARQEFPRPVRLGRRDYWSNAPVNHWLSRRFAVQEAWRIS
jgi:predicted DNA-binding transcriptional regulator AlpA